MTATEKPWLPDARPWREHDGGPCPIDGCELCYVLLRYRRHERSLPSDVPISADRWSWQWICGGRDGNIVAYLTKADSDAWESAQKAKAATVDPELIDALNEFARLGKDTDADRPLAVGDLVKHVAPGSPVMRVWLLSNDNSASVEWWVGNELKVCRFELSDLVRVPNE